MGHLVKNKPDPHSEHRDEKIYDKELYSDTALDKDQGEGYGYRKPGDEQVGSFSPGDSFKHRLLFSLFDPSTQYHLWIEQCHHL